MKKRIPPLLLICFILLFCSSCKNKNINQEKEPDYSAFTSNNSFNTNSPNSNENDTDDTHIDTDTLDNKEKNWPYELNFNGITFNKNYKTGNLNTNFKYSSTVSSLVCPDDENNVIYYVNYGKDNYIYQLKDGVSSLLIKKQANSLQLWNNELYFISNDNNSNGHVTGDIYRYNLMSQELRLIQQGNTELLYIDTYGMFFYSYDENGYYNGFTLGSESTLPQQVDYIFPASYNEYQILGSKDGIYLTNYETKEKVFLAPPEYIGYMLRLSEEYFMFTDQSCLYTLNLLNGDKKIYDLNDYEFIEQDIAYIYDYIVMDNILYASTGGYIYKLNMDSDEIESFAVISINGADSYNVDNLFTDGNRLFALANYYQSSTKKMVELTLTENDIKASSIKHIIITKELSE